MPPAQANLRARPHLPCPLGSLLEATPSWCEAAPSQVLDSRFQLFLLSCSSQHQVVTSSLLALLEGFVRPSHSPGLFRPSSLSCAHPTPSCQGPPCVTAFFSTLSNSRSLISQALLVRDKAIVWRQKKPFLSKEKLALGLLSHCRLKITSLALKTGQGHLCLGTVHPSPMTSWGRCGAMW